MLKTAAVTMASLLAAYPMLGILMPMLQLQNPYAVICSIYVLALVNAFVITRFVK